MTSVSTHPNCFTKRRSGLWRHLAAFAAALLIIAPSGSTQAPHVPVANQKVTPPPPTIRKAMLLDVAVDAQLWVEGNDAAPHDYAASTIEAVRAMIAQGAKRQRRLRVVIRDIHEHQDP